MLEQKVSMVKKGYPAGEDDDFIYCVQAKRINYSGNFTLLFLNSINQETSSPAAKK